MEDGLSFWKAEEALKDGKRIARKGWDLENDFLFERPKDTLDKDFIPKVKSLPDSVKEFLSNQNKNIKFTSYLCKWDHKNQKVINGWKPRKHDIWCEDWYILD